MSRLRGTVKWFDATGKDGILEDLEGNFYEFKLAEEQEEYKKGDKVSFDPVIAGDFYLADSVRKIGNGQHPVAKMDGFEYLLIKVVEAETMLAKAIEDLAEYRGSDETCGSAEIFRLSQIYKLIQEKRDV